ncbi:MAG TPA: M15 family metallopeptidase [Candidatus Limnocylindria bacterium]|nr:M15 family metallopeptidase [Candidatus Limnocylindria bacterium]
MRLRRALAGALFLAAAFVAVPLPHAAPAEAVGPLPKCRIDDILTVPRGYHDWSVTLVDWLLRVPRNYVPPDLVPVSEAGIAGPGLIREVAIDDLRALAQAAAANGTPIEVNSPYRSYREQVASFNGWVAVDGYEDAMTYSQRPGHSEHQLGLAIDFQALGGPSALDGDWYTTPTGRWMFDNAWRYGWVLSYPRGEGGALFSRATCFHYEPWHYRYLGREIARKVHRSGLTIREYLWKHHTMVDPNTGEPIATATPTPSPTPSPSPTPTATRSTTASATASPGSASAGATGLTGSPVRDLLEAEPPVLAAIGLGVLVLIGSIALAARRALSRR